MSDELTKKLYGCFTEEEIRRLREIKDDPDWRPRSNPNMRFNALKPDSDRQQFGLSMSSHIIKRVREVAQEKNIPISKLIEYILEATL